jgi:hypothetical protein
LLVKRSKTLERFVVSGDGDGVVGHAGALLLAEVADRLGLTAALGARPMSRRQRRSAHDPGRVLRCVAVMLVDGGDCLSDLAVLRDQPGSGRAEYRSGAADACSRSAAACRPTLSGSARMTLPRAEPTRSSTSAAAGWPSSTAMTRPSASASVKTTGGSLVPRPSRYPP